MVQRRAARYACNRYHNTSSVTDMLQTLTWPTLQQRRLKTKLIMFYKIVHHIQCSCSSYSNINTNRPKNQTISSIYIQTSSCIQRSVQVLILSEHNHSLKFTTSNYSSMPNSQHVQRTAKLYNTNCSQSSTITNLNKNEIVNSFNHNIYFCWHHL